MTNITEIKSCYLGPHISPEQFVPEHVFIYLKRGTIEGYDGYKKAVLHAGEFCLVRKNSLTRYDKQKDNGVFGKVVVVFDEAFLKKQQTHYSIEITNTQYKPAFYGFEKSKLVDNFIASLEPYYKGEGQMELSVAEQKRTELLHLLVQTDQFIANLLFNFGKPQKINLEAFMNHNYKFNVSLQRFAYLSGRSLSAFKRDFIEIFKETPSRWLVQRRLKEAYFLLKQKAQRPSDFYLDLGFEDLSHFSYAFKKQFGISPTKLSNKTVLA